jgi:hypothetical protein
VRVCFPFPFFRIYNKYVYSKAIINNTITAIVICLATASIGGIYSSTATDMGAQV